MFAFVSETEEGTNNIIKIHFMTNIRFISFNPITAKRFEDREEMYVGIKIIKTSKSAYFYTTAKHMYIIVNVTMYIIVNVTL